MPVRLSTRRVVRTIGVLLSAVAVVWIALRFSQGGAADVLKRAPIAPTALIGWLLACAIAYAISEILLALAWWRMLAAEVSGARTHAMAVMSAYAVSQYGKYLPGNVAHYAIRHAWSRRYGIAHGELGLASLLEAALLLTAALCLTLLAGTSRLRGLSIIDPRLALVLLAAIVVALGLVLRASRDRRVLGRFRVPSLPATPALASALACYFGFFVLSATWLDALAHALGLPIESFAMLLAASAASWLAGFVVIGAPGGLGIREATFVALAGGALGESSALMLIGLFRVVTFLGDTAFFAAGALVARAIDRASSLRANG